MFGSSSRMPGLINRAGLYILMGALLLGALWSGGYFPTPKWILAGLLLLAGLWEIAVNAFLGHKGVARSPAIWCFAAFVILALASSFWTVASGQTAREAVLLTGYLCALFVARSQIARSGARGAIAMQHWLVYTAGFAAAWGIATFLLRIHPYLTFLDGLFRAASTFEYPNALGCFELMALPVTLALHQESSRKEKPLFATVAVFEIAAVILAFSRLGLVLLMAVLVYFLLTARRRSLFMESALITITGFLMAAAALALGEAGYGKTGLVAVAGLAMLSYLGQSRAGPLKGRSALKSHFLFPRASIPVAAAGGGAIATLIALSGRSQLIIKERFGEGFSYSRLFPHRQKTWAAAYQAFSDRPLKGWGLGAFPEIFSRYQPVQFTKFAHNAVLQMAVDTGIFGAILFSLFLAYAVLLSLWRLLGKSDLMPRALAIGALAFIAYNMFDWEWYVPAITAWFMVILACLETETNN